MKNVKTIFLLLILCFSTKLNFATADDLKKAWEAFAINNRTEASNLFKQAANNIFLQILLIATSRKVMH